jgi:PAS domain S-box-containing protein
MPDVVRPEPGAGHVPSARPAPTARWSSPRFGRAAATAAFGFLGVVLLMGPDIIGGVEGIVHEPADIGLEAVFIVIGCVLVWVLGGRIVEAFLREAAERVAVERRESVLAEVLDAVPGAVLVLAGPPADPVIVHGNPASARLFGIGEDAVDGRRLAEVCPLDAATSTLVAGAIGGGAGWSGERVVQGAEGRRLSLSLAVTPIRGETGRAVLVATDETAVRFAERESERLATELEGFVEGAPLGFVTVGPDGLVAGWNPAAARILGHTPAEMLGRRLPAELGGAIAESLASGGSAGAARTSPPAGQEEIRLHRSTGEPVVVRLTATTAYGRGHEFFGFTAMFEDVTQRRHTEAERDEAQARFRAAVDASPVPLVLVDAEGRVRFWSAAAERMFGWSADEAAGEVFPPVPAEGRPRFLASLGRVLAGEMVSGDAFTYVGRDGRLLPARVWSSPVRGPDGSMVGVMGAFEEVRADVAPDA